MFIMRIAVVGCRVYALAPFMLVVLQFSLLRRNLCTVELFRRYRPCRRRRATRYGEPFALLDREGSGYYTFTNIPPAEPPSTGTEKYHGGNLAVKRHTACLNYEEDSADLISL